MKILITLGLALSVGLITACGGGGDSDNGNTSTSPPSPTPSTNTPPPSANTPTPSPTGEAPDLVTLGHDLYMEPQANGNTFACATCHALEEPLPDQFQRPGHPIGDALRRPNFKNGELANLIDAVNTCLETWMGVPQSELWTEESDNFTALQTFLADNDAGSGEAPTLSFAKAEPLTFSQNSDVSGDASAGQVHFNESCAVCHGQNAAGTNRAPSLANNYQFEGAAQFIARKVRLSGPLNHSIYPGDTVPGIMPFWAEDRIRDEDLEDVIAFIIQLDSANDMVDGSSGMARDCPSTHSKIGQTAELSTIAHDVSGTATIVNDCTIRIDNFSFDGGGINIRIYGGDGEFINTGFSMSDNLLDQVFTNETVYFTLPEDKTLDDLDRISVWCVPVRFSFGTGIFN